ncbi:hypothetical protein [Francisella persica]
MHATDTSSAQLAKAFKYNSIKNSFKQTIRLIVCFANQSVDLITASQAAH